MTRFEEATQSPFDMGIMVAFCIAAFISNLGVKEFTTDELKEFMKIIGKDVEEWLNEESQTGREKG